MDIKFEDVMKRYQDRITALIHANIVLECQVEQLQAQLDEEKPKTNGEGEVKVENLAALKVDG